MFDAIDTTFRIEVHRDIIKSLPPSAKEAENPPRPAAKNKEREKPEKVQVSQDFISELEQRFKTPHNFKLQFSMHEETGEIMAKVINMDTKKLIREIPTEAGLDLAAKIDEMIGILFDKKV